MLSLPVPPVTVSEPDPAIRVVAPVAKVLITRPSVWLSSETVRPPAVTSTCSMLIIWPSPVSSKAAPIWRISLLV